MPRATLWEPVSGSDGFLRHSVPSVRFRAATQGDQSEDGAYVPTGSVIVRLQAVGGYARLARGWLLDLLKQRYRVTSVQKQAPPSRGATVTADLEDRGPVLELAELALAGDVLTIGEDPVLMPLRMVSSDGSTEEVS